MAHYQQSVDLLLLLLTVCSARAVLRPGVQLGLSQHGLDYAAGVAVNQLSTKLVGEHIKDQHGSADVKVGKVDYDITNIVIQNFGKPGSRVTITPGAGLTWALSDASIQLHADWHYEYKLGFIRIKDSGTMDVSGSGISVSASVKMGVDKTGRPTIYTTACTDDISDLSVRFHGGASWLYNIFDDKIADALKDSLKDALCKAVEKSINEDGEKKLAKIDVVTDIGKNMVLDYSLTEAPVFTTGLIQSRHKGEIRLKNNPKHYPVGPAPFPTLTDLPRMAYIFASQYVINSYAYTAYTSGLVRYNLTADKMPKGDGGFLNTTCTTFGQVCIGNFLYKVAMKYPNSSLSIQMETDRAPYVNVNPKGANATFSGTMIFRAKTPEKKIVYLFTMALSVNMSIHVWLDDHTVRADVTSFVPMVKVVNSSVGNISNANMRMIFKIASDKFIVKKLNELGGKGIDLPNIKNVKYSKPVVKFYQGSLMFATDLVWSKDEDHLKEKRYYFSKGENSMNLERL